MKRSVTLVADSLPSTTTVSVFPDATYERWGIPTGLVFTSPATDAVLMPTFLRDPGCGFSIFTVTGVRSFPRGWHCEFGSELSRVIDEPAAALGACCDTNINPDFVRRASSEGYGALSNLSCHLQGVYHDSVYDGDVAVHTLTEEDISALIASCATLSNTIELRSVGEVLDHRTLLEWGVAEDDLVGFVHTGCGAYQDILLRRFGPRIAEASLEEERFALDVIAAGIFGVTAGSELGLEYQQWIRMAANFALVNRALVFKIVQHFLETRFSCSVRPLYDQNHCGIESGYRNGQEVLHIYRGAQSAYPRGQNHRVRAFTGKNTPTLVAGHKGTMALLCSGGPRLDASNGFVGHGVSWSDDGEPVGTGGFVEGHNQLISYSQGMFCNMPVNPYQVVPLSMNLFDAAQYYQTSEMLSPVAWLRPLINVQGRKRRTQPVMHSVVERAIDDAMN